MTCNNQVSGQESPRKEGLMFKCLDGDAWDAEEVELP